MYARREAGGVTARRDAAGLRAPCGTGAGQLHATLVASNSRVYERNAVCTLIIRIKQVIRSPLLRFPLQIKIHS